MRRISVALDGSAFAESALPFVITLAQVPTPCAVDLVGVHVPVPPPVRPLSSAALSETREQLLLEARRRHDLETYLNDAARRLSVALPHASINQTIRHGSAAEELTDHLVHSATDIAVLTTHGRGGWDRLWFGSVTHTLVDRGVCPVLAVRPAPVPRDYSTLIAAPLKTALLAVDEVTDATAALPTVAALLGQTLDLVRLLHVTPAPPRAMGRLLDGDRLDAMTERAAHEAAQLLSLAAQQWSGRADRVTAVVREGADPAETILGYLEAEGAHLLALITSPPSVIKRLFFDSVAEQLLQRAPVPLLFVPRTPA